MNKNIITLVLLSFFALTACDSSLPKKISVSGVDISQSQIILDVSESSTLNASILPTNATDKSVTWTIEDSNVASISSSGLVMGIADGETLATVTTVDGGFFDTCTIVVDSSLNQNELWDESQDNLRTGSKTIDFYNFNDFHGSTEFNSGTSEPGINKLSTYLKNAKTANPEGFVLTSSGDMWQGSADSNITRGRLVNDWMNLLEFSAMTLGNHEFDWTIETIHDNLETADFPYLACNIIKDDTNQPVDWVEPYTTITRNGVHIGIIGAIGEGITSDIISKNVEGLSFVDPTPYVVSWSQYLKQRGADVVLYLLHDTITSISKVEGNAADAIFGGHTHQGENNTESSPSTSFTTPAVQAWSNGKDIGHIQINYNFANQEITNEVTEILDVRSYLIASLADDSQTKTMYQTYLDNEISLIKDEVRLSNSDGIGQNDIPNVYNQYAYRYYKDYIDTKDAKNIFMVQTNAARAALPSGDITYGDIYKALPFDNSLYLISVKGSNITGTLSKYGTFYVPSQNSKVTGGNLKNYVDASKTYYVLMIDYVALKSPYSDVVTVVETYTEEDALPRNIVSHYIPGYPSNIN